MNLICPESRRDYKQYIVALPFVFWNVDTLLGLHLVIVWNLQMYFGQGLKELAQTPRPHQCNKLVRCLEGGWLAEYGFPSTHVMAVMAEAAVVVVHCRRYSLILEDELTAAVGISVLLLVCTATSRVYLGVHSVPDLIGPFFFLTVAFLKRPCHGYDRARPSPFRPRDWRVSERRWRSIEF